MPQYLLETVYQVLQTTNYKGSLDLLAMGNDATRPAASSHGGRKIKINVESSFAEEYKTKSLGTIAECRARLADMFGGERMGLGPQEFATTFEGVLADPSEHFLLFDARGKGVVDMLEVFAAAYLFAAGTRRGIDSKIERLFELFDFDANGELNEVEAEIMLGCVVRGAARVAMMPLPEDMLENAGKMVAHAFHLAKKSVETGELELRDVKAWVAEREDVSSYLNNIADARMIISSLEMVEDGFARGVDMFTEAAAEEAGGLGDGIDTIDGLKAGEILRSLTILRDMEACLRRGKEADADTDVTAAVRMLTGSSSARGGRGDRVRREVFTDFLRPWVAFSVVDDEGLGSVDAQDAKALLWLGGPGCGAEPPEANVQKTMNEIDESNDGRVERMEWMRYTAVLDEGAGNSGLDGGLTKVFRRYDDDRSGSITAHEMSMMVRDTVMEAIAESCGNSIRRGMEPVIETLVQDVARDMVAVMDGAASGLVGWTEFKKNQYMVATRLATLREFVLTTAQHRNQDSKTEDDDKGQQEVRLASYTEPPRPSKREGYST